MLRLPCQVKVTVQRKEIQRLPCCGCPVFLIACLHSQVALVSLPPAPACQSSVRRCEVVWRTGTGRGPRCSTFRSQIDSGRMFLPEALAGYDSQEDPLRGPAPSSITATFCEPHLAAGEDIANGGDCAEGQPGAYEIHCGLKRHLVG